VYEHVRHARVQAELDVDSRLAEAQGVQPVSKSGPDQHGGGEGQGHEWLSVVAERERRTAGSACRRFIALLRYAQ
jgi:hypothetical protein